MKTPEKIKVTVTFEIPEDIWQKVPDDLVHKGGLASVGCYRLTPADLLAFVVLSAALGVAKAPVLPKIPYREIVL